MQVNQHDREFQLGVVCGDYDDDGTQISIPFPQNPRRRRVDISEFLEDLRCASNCFARLITAEEKAEMEPVIIAHPNIARDMPIENSEPDAVEMVSSDVIPLDSVDRRPQSEHHHQSPSLRVQQLRDSARMHIRLITDLAFSIISESNSRNIESLDHARRDDTTLGDIPEVWGIPTKALAQIATTLFPDVLEDFERTFDDRPLDVEKLRTLMQTVDEILDGLHARVVAYSPDAAAEEPATTVAGATA